MRGTDRTRKPEQDVGHCHPERDIDPGRGGAGEVGEGSVIVAWYIYLGSGQC